MGPGVARLPVAWRHRCRSAAIALALGAPLAGCGFAEIFCGNTVGTCEAQIDDVRTVARADDAR
jgi:hypothetical protein